MTKLSTEKITEKSTKQIKKNKTKTKTKPVVCLNSTSDWPLNLHMIWEYD